MEKKEDRTPTDEEILERHRKARTHRRRRIAVTVAVVVIVVLAVVAFAVTRIRRGISERIGAGSDAAAQSAEVMRGSIRTTVSGSGILTNGDEEEVEMPASLVLEEYLVEEGDSVTEGEVIATVTSDSLLSTLTDTQEALDRLDEEIEEAEDDEVDDTITTAVAGRVKKIWAQSGDEVASVMAEDGALLVLSLDGKMAVDVEAGNLAADDEVTVTDSTGESWDGTVEKVREGTAVILITDRGPAFEEEVVVTDADGQTVGSGTLYIHRSLEITGYAGTVKKVQVSSDSLVEAGDPLFTLEDTSVTSRRDALLKEREETEQTLKDLIAIQKQGGVCAGSDGEIVSLSDGTAAEYGLTLAAAQDSTDAEGTAVIASLTAEDTMAVTFDVDETEILSLAEGQEASVGIDSLGEETYEGTVTGIGSEASSASGVTTYAAEVTIGKAEGMLAGMSASVDIEIEGVEDALLIPADALQETSTTAYVYTQYDEESGELSGMTEVTAGLRNSSYVEITAGLSEGDTVYYSASDDAAGFGGFPFGSMGGMGAGGAASDENGGNGFFGQGGGMGDAGREGMPSGSGGRPDASAGRPGASDGN